MKFKDWFDTKLKVGPFPVKQNQWFKPEEHDIVINVSDEYYPDVDKKIQSAGGNTFWFPMNECKRDIGLNSIYGAMVVLWNAEQENKRVYLHCHAGVNRSPTVQAAYYFLRSGNQLQKEQTGYINRLVAACARGYLPPKPETEQFLSSLATHLKNMGGQPLGGLLDEVKVDNIKNF